MKRTILTLVLVPFLALLALASSKPKTLSELPQNLHLSTPRIPMRQGTT